MKYLRQIAFYFIFVMGLLIGVWLGLTLFGLSIGLLTTLFEWIFPQYVIPNPIDYAGPLPEVAIIAVLGVAWLTSFINLRKFYEWIKVGFDKAKATTHSGNLIVGLPSILVLSGLFSTYFTCLLFSIVIALLTLISALKQILILTPAKM